MSVAVRYWLLQALWVYEMLIFAYAISSWFVGNSTARSINRALGVVCEPFVGLIRRILPSQASGGVGIDLAPLIAILILILLQSLVR